MFIDEAIDLREDLPEGLQRDFAELRSIMMRTIGFILIYFLRRLRQVSRHTIWQGKSAGRI